MDSIEEQEKRLNEILEEIEKNRINR